MKLAPFPMSHSLRIYRLQSIFRGVGNVRAFGESRVLPTADIYTAYAVTTVADHYANVSTNDMSVLRRGWLSLLDVYNTVRAVTNVVHNGLLVPSHQMYYTILDGVLILAVLGDKRNLYLSSYIDHRLQGIVSRSSVTYVSDDQLPVISATDTLVVNGYLRPTTPSYTRGDTIDHTVNEHVTEWRTVCLKACGSTTIRNVIHTVVKLHDQSTMVHHNDIEMYLCSGAINCTDCASTSNDYGVLVMDIADDYVTLTHQYTAVSNRALKEAHAALRRRREYVEGDVYLRWSIRNDQTRMPVNTSYMHQIYRLGDDAMRVISNDSSEYERWSAQSLASSTLSKYIDGATVSTTELINAYGHAGLCDIYGGSLRHGSTVIPDIYSEYIVIKYGDVTTYSPNTIMVYDHPHYEIIPGTLGDTTTMGYVELTGTVDKHDRIYAKEQGMLDITDTARIAITDGVVTKAYGYTNTLYVRSLECIILYAVTLTRDAYVNDNVVLPHTENINGHVSVWINDYALINGLDYHVSKKDIHIYSVLRGQSDQNIVVLIKPTIQGVSAVTDVYRAGMVVTQNGSRVTEPVEETRYGVEYPAWYFTAHTADDMLSEQLVTDRELTSYLNDVISYPPYTIVSPFMNRVLNIAVAASDAVLRNVKTYRDIYSYLYEYMYMLETEPTRTVDMTNVTLLTHPADTLSLTSTQYEFIERIGIHYEFNLDLSNLTKQPNT